MKAVAVIPADIQRVVFVDVSGCQQSRKLIEACAGVHGRRRYHQTHTQQLQLSWVHNLVLTGLVMCVVDMDRIAMRPYVQDSAQSRGAFFHSIFPATMPFTCQRWLCPCQLYRRDSGVTLRMFLNMRSGFPDENLVSSIRYFAMQACFTSPAY